MPASCTCCAPATPRCKPLAPAVPVVVVASVLIWRCTALRSLHWAAGWASCRCDPVLCVRRGTVCLLSVVVAQVVACNGL